MTMTADQSMAPAPNCPPWCTLGEAGHARDLATGITDEYHAHRRVLRRVTILADRWPHPGNQAGCLDVLLTREDDFIPAREPHPAVVTLGDMPLTPEEARAIAAGLIDAANLAAPPQGQ